MNFCHIANQVIKTHCHIVFACVWSILKLHCAEPRVGHWGSWTSPPALPPLPRGGPGLSRAFIKLPTTIKVETLNFTIKGLTHSCAEKCQLHKPFPTSYLFSSGSENIYTQLAENFKGWLSVMLTKAKLTLCQHCANFLTVGFSVV